MILELGELAQWCEEGFAVLAWITRSRSVAEKRQVDSGRRSMLGTFSGSTSRGASASQRNAREGNELRDAVERAGNGSKGSRATSIPIF